LKEFGIEILSSGSQKFIAGSPADQGKSIIANNTGLSEKTIKLLLNECDHARKSKNERSLSQAESLKKSEA